MKSNPLVSIVLPTYNGVRYLAESIQSCIDQSYTNWELLIVDDASSDATPEIIGRYVHADSRISCVRNAGNRKLPASLNAGFAKAKGLYFTWTSDDNCFKPAALGRMVEYLETHPQTGIVYTDFTEINEQGSHVGFCAAAAPEKLVYGNVVMASFMYRRAVYDHLKGYNENLFLVEDYDFWLRASLHFRLSPLHEDLYTLRQHGSSLTNTRMAEIRKKHEKLLCEYLPRLHWISKKERALGFLMLAQTASRRQDLLLTAEEVFQACRIFFSFAIVKTSTELLMYALAGKRRADLFFTPYKKLKKLFGL